MVTTIWERSLWGWNHSVQCRGGYTNLHCDKNDRTLYKCCTNVVFLVLILYYSYIRGEYWETFSDFPVLAFTISNESIIILK